MIKLKTNLLLLALLCLAANVLVAKNTMSTFSDAKVLAKSQNKNIFVKYSADWCLPCQIFEEQVLSHDFVKKFLDDEFVTFEADFDEEENKTLFENNNILCLPTLHVTDESGAVLLELNGNMSKRPFLEALKPFAMNHTFDFNIVEESKILPVKVEEVYVIQVGAFRSFENALLMKEKVAGITAHDILITHDSERNLYPVQVGQFSDLQDFEKLVQKLKLTRIDYFVKRRKI